MKGPMNMGHNFAAFETGCHLSNVTPFEVGDPPPETQCYNEVNQCNSFARSRRFATYLESAETTSLS